MQPGRIQPAASVGALFVRKYLAANQLANKGGCGGGGGVIILFCFNRPPPLFPLEQKKNVNFGYHLLNKNSFIFLIQKSKIVVIIFNSLTSVLATGGGPCPPGPHTGHWIPHWTLDPTLLAAVIRLHMVMCCATSMDFLILNRPTGVFIFRIVLAPPV